MESGVPHSVRTTIIDLHFRLASIIEEQEILQQEATHFCLSVKDEMNYLSELDRELDIYGFGLVNAIHKRIHKLEIIYAFSQHLFKDMPNVELHSLHSVPTVDLDKPSVEEALTRECESHEETDEEEDAQFEQDNFEG